MTKQASDQHEEETYPKRPKILSEINLIQKT